MSDDARAYENRTMEFKLQQAIHGYNPPVAATDPREYDGSSEILEYVLIVLRPSQILPFDQRAD